MIVEKVLAPRCSHGLACIFIRRARTAPSTRGAATAVAVSVERGGRLTRWAGPAGRRAMDGWITITTTHRHAFLSLSHHAISSNILHQYRC